MRSDPNSDHLLELSFHFDASPEAVFDAWLQTDWVERLPPPGASCRLIEMDARVGGAYKLAMTMRDGRTVAITGTYRTIERPRLLVMTWCGSYDSVETTIELNFACDETGTSMRLRHSGFSNRNLRDGFGAGWKGSGGTFEKLVQHLAGKAV